MSTELEQKRRTANLEILNILRNIVEKHPWLRFTQILTVLKLDTDKFYQEPWDTLEEVKKLAEKFN